MKLKEDKSPLEFQPNTWKAVVKGRGTSWPALGNLNQIEIKLEHSHMKQSELELCAWVKIVPERKQERDQG